MYCKDCLSFGVCRYASGSRLLEKEPCANFMDIDKWVKLPCKVGTKHNHLAFVAVDEEKSKERGRLYYILRCDCGNIKSIRKDLWESGNTKACGCLYETHGQAKGNHSRLYNIYHGMKKTLL